MSARLGELDDTGLAIREHGYRRAGMLAARMAVAIVDLVGSAG